MIPCGCGLLWKITKGLNQRTQRIPHYVGLFRPSDPHKASFHQIQDSLSCAFNDSPWAESRVSGLTETTSLAAQSWERLHGHWDQALPAVGMSTTASLPRGYPCSPWTFSGDHHPSDQSLAHFEFYSGKHAWHLFSVFSWHSLKSSPLPTSEEARLLTLS